MSNQERFTDAEWRSLVSAPGAALLAIVANNEYGMIRMFKELRAGSKVLKAAQKGEWPPVVAEMITYLDENQKELAPPDTTEEPDEVLGLSLNSISDAGSAATKLEPKELDGYVKWVIDIATAAADATTEGDSPTPISEQERELLDDIERRLRAR